MTNNAYPEELDKEKELHKQRALFGLSQIGRIVEMSMVTPGPHWLHVDASNYKNTGKFLALEHCFTLLKVVSERQVQYMLHTMQEKLTSLKLVPDPRTDARLPPASAQWFLKESDGLCIVVCLRKKTLLCYST